MHELRWIEKWFGKHGDACDSARILRYLSMHGSWNLNDVRFPQVTVFLLEFPCLDSLEGCRMAEDRS